MHTLYMHWPPSTFACKCGVHCIFRIIVEEPSQFWAWDFESYGPNSKPSYYEYWDGFIQVLKTGGRPINRLPWCLETVWEFLIMGTIFGIIHVIDIVDCIQQPLPPPATYHPHMGLQLFWQLPVHSQSMGRKLWVWLQAGGGVSHYIRAWTLL